MARTRYVPAVEDGWLVVSREHLVVAVARDWACTPERIETVCSAVTAVAALEALTANGIGDLPSFVVIVRQADHSRVFARTVPSIWRVRDSTAVGVESGGYIGWVELSVGAADVLICDFGAALEDPTTALRNAADSRLGLPLDGGATYATSLVASAERAPRDAGESAVHAGGAGLPDPSALREGATPDEPATQTHVPDVAVRPSAPRRAHSATRAVGDSEQPGAVEQLSVQAIDRDDQSRRVVGGVVPHPSPNLQPASAPHPHGGGQRVEGAHGEGPQGGVVTLIGRNVPTSTTDSVVHPAGPARSVARLAPAMSLGETRREPPTPARGVEFRGSSARTSEARTSDDARGRASLDSAREATVPRYVFQGPDGERIVIAEPVIVGRSPTPNVDASMGQPVLVTVHGDDVSRCHLQIAVEGGTLVLTDLYSLNGTRVFGPDRAVRALRGGEPTPVIAPLTLELGDVVCSVNTL